MTIRDIAKQVKWKDVELAIRYLYPDDKNNYKPVFDFLQKVGKSTPKVKDEFIHVEVVGVDDLNPEGEYYSVSTNLYSMSFRKWRELSNIPLEPAMLKYRVNYEIIAHFIWEITFYGTEKDSMRMRREMHKRVKSITKKNVKPYKKASK